MTGTTLVVGELHDGGLSDATKEAVGVAANLSGLENVVGFLAGPSARAAAAGFGKLGVKRAFVAELAESGRSSPPPRTRWRRAP